MLRHINFFIMCVRSCISLIVYLLLQCIKLAKREMFDWKIISIYVQDLYLFRSHDYISFNWLIAYVCTFGHNLPHTQLSRFGSSSKTGSLP